MDGTTTVKGTGSQVTAGSCLPYTKYTAGNIFESPDGIRVIIIEAPQDKRMIVNYWTAIVQKMGGMWLLDHNQLMSRLHGYAWMGRHEEALNTMISHEARKDSHVG